MTSAGPSSTIVASGIVGALPAALAVTRLRFEALGIDNPEVDDLRDLTLRDDTTFEAAHDLPKLGGITALQCAATVDVPTRLYHPVSSEKSSCSSRPTTATAIPYYAWANRGPSPMTVWLNRA